MSDSSNQRDAAWVSNFLASRRTTRDFRSDHIPQQIIDELLKDALTAPSWSNTRPFKVAVATGEQRDRISNEFQNRWEVVSTALRGNFFKKTLFFLKRYGLPTSNRMISKPYVAELKPRAQRVGKEMYEFIGVKRSDRVARDRQWAKNYEFFGAPVEMFIFVHRSLDIFAANDAGLMLENLILSAHARGLGTCLQGAVSIWDDVVRDEFDIPKEYRLLCGLALGYPSDAQINRFRANRIDITELKFKSKK